VQEPQQTTSTTVPESNITNNNNHNSSRWRVDYAADVSVGMNSIEGWEFKTKLVLDKELGNSFPLALYMEKPAAFGQNANKLLLLACKKVPPQVREMLHPGAFQPRRSSDGWVTDPNRKRQMWQKADNGMITWDIEQYTFYQVSLQHQTPQQN
jgi:hypothetical protein